MGSHSSEDSAPDPQEVQWLTPAPDGTPVHLPWPDPDGPFLLTCHLAQVDGRTMLVGLDMRCFSLDADGRPTPGRPVALDRATTMAGDRAARRRSS